MIAAGYPAPIRRDKTETATARNRRVRREITSAYRDKRINFALCDFLQLVITECHLETWAYHSRKEWAAIVGKSVSSIKLYIRVACELGYTRLDAAGRLYMIGLEAPAEPLFLAPEQDAFLSHTDNILSPPSFNELIQDIQEGATAPLPPRRRRQSSDRFFGREDRRAVTIPDTPATTLLQEHGVEDPVTLRRLAECDTDLIRRKVAEMRQRSKPPHNPPGYLVWLVDQGVKARPMAPHREFETTPDPESFTVPDPLPSICPTCGRLCPAEWHGHCPTCDPGFVRETFGRSDDKGEL